LPLDDRVRRDVGEEKITFFAIPHRAFDPGAAADDALDVDIERHQFVETRIDANDIDLLNRLGRLRLSCENAGARAKCKEQGDWTEEVSKLVHGYLRGRSLETSILGGE